MKKDPAAFESPEAVALLKAKYRSAADKKRQAISALEQSVSDMKIEEARLRSRLAECRTGSGCAPGEPRAQGLPGPSAATGQSHAESERRERHSKRSWSHLLSARKAMAPADSGGVGSGPLLGLEERMELLRAQKRKTQNSLRCLRHQWSTEETYIKHRISAAKRQLAKRGGAPAFPSSETLESYRQTYRTRVVTRRQEMGVLEKLIHEMEIEEEQLRSRLLKCRSKAGEAPTEPSTEGHAGASTSTSQSQGLTVTGRSDIESGSAETESADLPEEASPVPGCSWWSIISPAELLGPTPKSAESSPPAEDRVKMLESELRLLRARRSNLISMRHNLRYKWKNEASYLHTKLLMLKYRRKAKNMATVGLSPELHQRLSQQYRERAPQHLARVEEMSRQIMALEEEAKEVAVQLLHARRLSDPAVETQTQASTVSSATEPAETSEVAGHHSPRDTIHARRDLVKSHSEPALEKPLDEAVASPFVAQIPSRSPTPVTTTEGASRESAALASTTHSMASGDLTTSSDWFTHAERTSESPSPLILHHQTAPLFAAGAPEAVVYGGPCTSGDSGGPPYSLSQIFEHAGAAHTTGYPRTESDIPEDVVEFVLSHSAPAVMASEDGAALFAESAPSFNQPWSSEYPPPRIVSPSEQAATSASLFQPTTSASDEGATLFAVPASSSAFSGPGWSSPQLQPSWCRHRMHPDTNPNSGIPASREYPDEMRYQSQGGSYVATWIEQYGPHLID
ncbi:hypothetical protein TGFOU_220630 [Toxoplasma gondii FOU]|uniref:Uncharacterized protein n=2 Tax=Toxoplasma gondii TaxID=5811 RepID=A0A086JT54_TOXGO|nr:hypothetical protein TGFOU_220630 [Toxoplasma gondii FOU]